MKVVYKLILALIFLILVFPLSRAQVGVGIWPAKVEVEVPIFKTSIVEINFFNPTEKNVSLEIEFYCRNCEEDVILFGKKICKRIYDLDVKISPLYLELQPKNLNQSQKVFVKTFNPLFLKSWFKLRAFGREVEIPFVAPFFDEKEFEYRILAGIQEKQLKIQIAGDVLFKFKGIEKLSFLLALCVVVLALVIFFKKHVESEFSTYEKLS